MFATYLHDLRRWLMRCVSLGVTLLWVSTIVPVCAAAFVVHPVSHTDAWVKVADQVDVRLNIFLDDVLRYEGLLSGEPDRLPTESVARAIAAYSERIVTQLQIYGQDGKPLSAVVVASPAWTQPRETVDLKANELLKLTWKLRFQPADTAALSLLTFEHQFTHPDLPTPGELRLHVQHQPTARRLDAVVPPGRAHVLHLPQNRALLTGRDLNVMQTRLVRNAGSISVEFLAPASVLLAADEMAGPSVAEARERLTRWARTNVSAIVNAQPSVPSSVLVDFPELSPELRGRGADAIVADSDQLDWRTRLAGIRLQYPRPPTVRVFQLSVRSWPVDFHEASVELVSPPERSTQLVECDPAAEFVLHFDWQPAVLLPDPSAGLPQELVRSEPSQTGRVGAVMLWLSGIVCLWWGRALWRRHPKSASVLLLVVLLAGCVSWSMQRDQTDSVALTRFLQGGLSRVYASLMWNDEVAMVDSLSELMQPDLVEQTFLTAVASVRGQSGQPVTTIHDLKITDVRTEPAVVSGRLQCQCCWQVDVTVEHWGHAHERQLMFSGSVALEAAGDRWRIAEFRPGEAKYAEN